MISAPEGAAAPVCGDAADADPLVQRYRAFFARLDWSAVCERDPGRPWPGSPPHPRVAYVKALLVKLCEGKRFITDLRSFLLEHPHLVRELGFRPVLDPTQPLGFAVARTVPGARWLRHQPQRLDPAMRRALVAATVRALQAAIPGLGTTIAVDVTHIFAWVRQHNPKETIAHRFDPTRQPRGDPDCRLGAKGRANQEGRREKTYLWGYGTGIVSATDPDDGDVVLAELTLPFHHQASVWVPPLDDRAVAVLGRRPTNLAADAACDAWHVDQTCAADGGLAAIPRNCRGASPPRDADGHPICARGRSLVPVAPCDHEDGFRAQRYRCPLLWPARTGQACDHAQCAKGPGCTKDVNLEAGGRMRAELDRRSEPDRAVYRQRTAAERINSQAEALGIERPKVRNGDSVHRLNTLTSIVINARALQRVCARTAATHPPPVLTLC